jgi:hypothetical protein
MRVSQLWIFWNIQECTAFFGKITWTERVIHSSLCFCIYTFLTVTVWMITSGVQRGCVHGYNNFQERLVIWRLEMAEGKVNYYVSVIDAQYRNPDIHSRNRSCSHTVMITCSAHPKCGLSLNSSQVQGGVQCVTQTKGSSVQSKIWTSDLCKNEYHNQSFEWPYWTNIK